MFYKKQFLGKNKVASKIFAKKIVVFRKILSYNCEIVKYLTTCMSIVQIKIMEPGFIEISQNTV